MENNQKNKNEILEVEDKDYYKNDLLIRRTIEEHLKITDEKQKDNMEKQLIYSLLN